MFYLMFYFFLLMLILTGGQLLYSIQIAPICTTWISHRYTCVTPILNPSSHLPPHPVLLGCPSTSLWYPVSCTGLSLAICFTHVCICFNTYSLKSSHSSLPLSPSLFLYYPGLLCYLHVGSSVLSF